MRAHFKARCLFVAVLLMMVVAGLSAHDFWLEPSTFEPALDEAVRIRLRVGEHFSGEPVARNESRIEQFVAVGPSGEKPVVGRDGMDPAGLVRLDAPGLWFVGYRGKATTIELAADKFEQYLREEGLERIIEDRAARSESKMTGRERFSRSVKSLLRSGGSRPGTGFDRALGLTLEFVLDADPIAADGGRLPVRLLHEGRPLEGALVVAYRKNQGAPAIQPGQEALRARTDREGRVTLAVEPGVWLLKAVHMSRTTAPGADWDSVWTALTFRVP
jgi:uncharacterized GH25 family protein